MNGKRKKLAAALLAGALFCTGITVPASAAAFSDVSENAWYRGAVYDLVDKGIITGTSADTFTPDGRLTRGAFATMLAQTVLSKDELSQYDFKGGFKDLSQAHWSNRFVNWAAEAGVVSGYEDKTFRPDKPVSREEMAVMVVNFAKATGRKMVPVSEAADFADSGTVSRFAASSVRLCQQAGIINGYKEDGTFRPQGLATRAEAAVLYSSFLQKCLLSDRYTLTRKRVRSVPVRAVEFDPAQYTANLAMGHDVTDGAEAPASMVERLQPFLAVNAAFFDLNSYLPLGTVIKEGRVVTVSDQYAPAKSSLTLDASGRFSIQNFRTVYTVSRMKEDGTEDVLSSIAVNRWPSSEKDAARILFTRDWGHNLCFKAVDAVTLDENGVILSVDHNKDVEIPEKGCVLAQRARREYEGDFFDSCQVGGQLTVRRVYEGIDQDPVLSIGAGPRIVKDGAPYGDLSTYRAEGFTDPNITTYDALRVCIGLKPDGKMVIVSATATLQKMSELLVAFGCTDGINLDGGGSANLYVDGTWVVGPQGRKLNNMLYFK